MVRQYSWRSFSWLKIQDLVLKWLHNHPQNILRFAAQTQNVMMIWGLLHAPSPKYNMWQIIMNFDNPCYVVTSILQVVMIQKQRKKRWQLTVDVSSCCRNDQYKYTPTWLSLERRMWDDIFDRLFSWSTDV